MGYCVKAAESLMGGEGRKQWTMKDRREAALSVAINSHGKYKGSSAPCIL